MFKKLCISLIFSNLVVIKLLSSNHRIHNLYTKFVKFLEICKQFSNKFVNEAGNIGSVRKAGCNPCSRFQYYAHNLDSLNKKNGMSATPLNWLLKAFTLALNDSAPALVCLFTKKLSMVS